MIKLKLKPFEKYIIYRTAIIVSLILGILGFSVFIQLKLVVSNNFDLQAASQMVINILLVMVLTIAIICLGLFWIIKIIRQDKNQMFIMLGATKDISFYDEFAELNKAYLNQIDRIKSLKTQYLEKTSEVAILDKEVKGSFIQYNKRLNICESSEKELANLKDFFDKLAEKLPTLIWLTDYQGNIVYCNSLLRQNFDYKLETIYDVLSINSNQFEMFRNRNFSNILLYLKGQNSVAGKNLRIFENDKLKYNLFISETSNQEKVMNRSYLKKSRDLHFINEISKIISGQITIDSTLQDAIEKIAFLGNFNSCSIRLLNENNELVLKAFSGYIREYVLGNKVTTENSHIGYAFNENKILTINTLEDMLFDDAAVKKIILDNRKIAYIPLTNYSKTLGVMSILSDYDFDSESLILLDSISINVTIALEKILLYEQLKSNYFKTVEAFVTASEIKSDKYSGHSRRVAQICRIIAEKLYLNAKEVDEIYMAGLLHDVGKLAFSDNSLDYYFDIDNHGAIGKTMVERVGLTKDILEGIEFHHMNFDLKNSKDPTINEQPYYAQIIRIANDFDLYMNYETTNIAKPSFVEDMKDLIGTAYSPQFMRIIADILENESSLLLSIYQNEVLNEK